MREREHYDERKTTSEGITGPNARQNSKEGVHRTTVLQEQQLLCLVYDTASATSPAYWQGPGKQTGTQHATHTHSTVKHSPVRTQPIATHIRGTRPASEYKNQNLVGPPPLGIHRRRQQRHNADSPPVLRRDHPSPHNQQKQIRRPSIPVPPTPTWITCPVKNSRVETSTNGIHSKSA